LVRKPSENKVDTVVNQKEHGQLDVGNSVALAIVPGMAAVIARVAEASVAVSSRFFYEESIHER
jgi:hypothetical protein